MPLSRPRTYHWGDPDCEADYRNAFFLDSGLAAREMVQQLEDELHRDVAYVLLGCRRRLRFNPQDLIARTRLGLALLILHQEAGAFHELQQVFSQGPVWRPFLRLLVNQTRPRRSIVHSRLLWSSGRTASPIAINKGASPGKTSSGLRAS